MMLKVKCKYFRMSRLSIYVLAVFLIASTFSFASSLDNLKSKARAGDESVHVTVGILHVFPVLADLNENIKLLNSKAEEAFRSGANIVVAPELATTGYSITFDQVIKGLGLKPPFDELARLKSLAHEFNGYIILGIAEIGDDGNAYNSALVLKPDETFYVQRKRGKAGFNARGDTPFAIVETPFCDIGVSICSDTYLMDWTRILALAGADIIITPANWWGDMNQLGIWSTRAHEDGVYIVVANRWGRETDTRFGTPYNYNMNDAPSAVISPSGKVLFSYKADDDAKPGNRILYYRLQIPRYRIGTKINPSWSIKYRKPIAYKEIANSFYRPDLDNKPVSDLPPAGKTKIGVMTYLPQETAEKNLMYIQQLYKSSKEMPDVLLLPAYGIQIYPPVDTTKANWRDEYPWHLLQKFVDESNVELLVTSAFEKYTENGPNRDSMVIVRPGKPIVMQPSIHPYPVKMSSITQEPYYVDLPNARIGLAFNRDAIMPEVPMSLAKSGTDILLIPADIGGSKAGLDQYSTNDAYNLWKTLSNNIMHIVASSDLGIGVIVENNNGAIENVVKTDWHNSPYCIISLDSAKVRTKFLDAYYQFDLQSLLGYTK